MLTIHPKMLLMLRSVWSNSSSFRDTPRAEISAVTWHHRRTLIRARCSVSHLYELHLHNLNRRLPDEMPDEFQVEKASESSSTLASASWARRTFPSVRARARSQVVVRRRARVILMLSTNQFGYSSLTSCSVHLAARDSSASNDARVIDCRFAVAAVDAVGGGCPRCERTIWALTTGTLR